MGKHLSCEFKFIIVLRDVDAIAALLFNAVLEIAVGRSKAKIWGNMFDKCRQTMASSADVIIMGIRVKDIIEEFT